MKKYKTEMRGTGMAGFIIVGSILISISINGFLNSESGDLRFIFPLMALIVGICLLATGLYHLYPLRKEIKERFEEVFL